MKKLILIFVILFMSAFLVFWSYSADKITHLTYPSAYIKKDTLSNSATNKCPADTFLIDFLGTPEYLNADSGLIFFKMDTVVGKYGNQPTDSLGRNPVRIRTQPVLTYPPSLPYYETSTINDTLTVDVPASLTDSAYAVGEWKVYTFPIRYPQYRLIIDHFYDDSSNANPQGKTLYEGFIGLKKKDRLSSLDLINSITGNPDLELNPTALGDVRLFSDAGTIANGSDGKRLIIYRKETGDRDSIQIYIDQDGSGYFINNLTEAMTFNIGSTIYLDADNGTFLFQDGGTETLRLIGDIIINQLLFKTRDAIGNQFVIGDDAKDYDHALDIMPKVYIQGAKDPDSSNQYYGAQYHDSSDFVMETGAGIGAGLTPTEISNGISFRPRGTEAMYIDSVGAITMDSSLTVAYSVTGTEFIEASKMFVGSNPIGKLKQVTRKAGTKIGDWAEIDHEKLPDGVKVPIIKQFYKDKVTGNEVWKPDMNSYISRFLVPYVEEVIYMDEDSVEQKTYRNIFKDEITDEIYVTKREFINTYYELINKQSYGKSLTGIVDIMRNAILELKAENDLLKERIDKLEIQ